MIFKTIKLEIELLIHFVFIIKTKFVGISSDSKFMNEFKEVDVNLKFHQVMLWHAIVFDSFPVIRLSCIHSVMKTLN